MSGSLYIKCTICGDFSNVWLPDPLVCQWSVYQRLNTWVCRPWYRSPEVYRVYLLPPDGQCKGTSIGIFLTFITQICLKFFSTFHSELPLLLPASDIPLPPQLCLRFPASSECQVVLFFYFDCSIFICGVTTLLVFADWKVLRGCFSK